MEHRGLLLAALLVAVVGFCESKKVTCKVKGDEMTRFGGSWYIFSSITLPCKYRAVKQRCDKYEVTVNPTAKLYGSKGYYTDAIRVVVRDAESKKRLWEGRTDNDTASKFLAKEAKEAFTVIDQDASFNPKIKKQGDEILFKDRASKFEVVYKPMTRDLTNTSTWRFTCQLTGDDKKYRGKDDLAATVYSAQLCDDNKGLGMSKRISDLSYGKDDDSKAIFFDTLIDADLTQSGSCKDGVEIFSKVWESQQQTVLDQCWQIIGSKGHTQCIAKNLGEDVDIMAVFNSCVRYMGGVGSESQQDRACEAVGKAIDGCREFKGLSNVIKQAGCVIDFSYGN